MGEELALKSVLVILSIGSLALAAGIPIMLWVLSGMRREIGRLFELVEKIPPQLATHAEKINVLERTVERRRGA